MILRTTLIPCTMVLAIAVTPSGNAASIGVTHDTWVREDNADSNRNGNDQMNARTDIDADDNDVILLRFPTTGIPSGISGLELSLFWQRSDSSTGNELALYGLNETDPDETTWDETTVTYNNAPGLIPDGIDPAAENGLGNTFDDIRDLDTANLTLLVDAQPYGPQVLNDPYSFSSAALDSFVNADTNGEVTFLILRANAGTSGNQARFWPRESGPGATLSYVPEPASIALIGLGAVALAVGYRRASSYGPRSQRCGRQNSGGVPCFKGAAIFHSLSETEQSCMQLRSAILLAVVWLVVCHDDATAQLLAFPGAEGGGKYAKGGRDGDVYVVSNLDNSGFGSLRHAIDTAPTAGRVIVFSVGGTIDLTSDIVIDSPNITLAGQTAPIGITLAHRALRVNNTHDVIVQHIAVRPGDTYTAPNVYEPDAIWVSGSNDVILDHVSTSWSTDEVLSITHESSNVTVQWSVISEALHNSNHSKGNHGYGGIFEAGETTLHHNLYAHNRSRNPRLAGADAAGTANRADVVNNVIFNPGDRYSYSGSSDTYEVNWTGNYGIEGPSTTRENELFHPDSTGTQVYYADNYYDTQEDGILQLTPAAASTLTGTYTPLASPVTTARPPMQTDAPTAYAQVLSYAGSAANRDPIDKRIVNSVIRQNGAHIDSQDEVGGWFYPTPINVVLDPDGLPDWWKIGQGLDPDDNTIGLQRPVPGGYTYLEMYLHELNAPYMPPSESFAVTISTAFGNGADAQISESFDQSTGNGGGAELNTRWMGGSGDANDLVLLRFDLSQIELGSVAGASLDLTAFRDLGDHAVRVYGLDHDAANQDWDESSVTFATAPGVVFDADSRTRSLDEDSLLLLGEFTTKSANEGDVVSFSNPDLIAFLNMLAYRENGGEVVTLLLERAGRERNSDAVCVKGSRHARNRLRGTGRHLCRPIVPRRGVGRGWRYSSRFQRRWVREHGRLHRVARQPGGKRRIRLERQRRWTERGRHQRLRLLEIAVWRFCRFAGSCKRLRCPSRQLYGHWPLG